MVYIIQSGGQHTSNAAAVTCCFLSWGDVVGAGHATANTPLSRQLNNEPNNERQNVVLAYKFKVMQSCTAKVQINFLYTKKRHVFLLISSINLNFLCYLCRETA